MAVYVASSPLEKGARNTGSRRRSATPSSTPDHARGRCEQPPLKQRPRAGSWGVHRPAASARRRCRSVPAGHERQEHRGERPAGQDVDHPVVSQVDRGEPQRDDRHRVHPGERASEPDALAHTPCPEQRDRADRRVQAREAVGVDRTVFVHHRRGRLVQPDPLQDHRVRVDVAQVVQRPDRRHQQVAHEAGVHGADHEQQERPELVHLPPKVEERREDRRREEVRPVGEGHRVGQPGVDDPLQPDRRLGAEHPGVDARQAGVERARVDQSNDVVQVLVDDDAEDRGEPVGHDPQDGWSRRGPAEAQQTMANPVRRRGRRQQDDRHHRRLGGQFVHRQPAAEGRDHADQHDEEHGEQFRLGPNHGVASCHSALTERIRRHPNAGTEAGATAILVGQASVLARSSPTPRPAPRLLVGYNG